MAATNRYATPDPSQARRQRRLLNPIMEEDSDEGRMRGRRQETPHLKIEAWLSPMSDHFPTPRGIHYLSAPVLPSSPSADSASECSPTGSANPWNRGSRTTMATEYDDDIYDVSEPEDETPKKIPQRRPSARSRPHSAKPPSRLIIPTGGEPSNEQWSAVDELKKMTSPVPVTPSAKLTMSPAQVSFMDMQQSLAVPTISAPPSLDGSLTSEQLAAMSAPPTPVMDNDDVTTEDVWAGVQLQPGALATLHALSGNEEELHEHPVPVIENHPVAGQRAPEMQQQPHRLVTSLSMETPRTATFSPIPMNHSLDDLTRLDIPSPGGFFSDLSPQSRSTWNISSADEVAPPTSTTAEQFYKCPWNEESVPPVPERAETLEDFYRPFTPAPSDQQVVERVIELGNQDYLGDDMPTARQVPLKKPVDEAPASPVGDDAATEIVVDYDPDYARKQQEVALSNLDRTGTWLMAQRAYLRGVDEPVVSDAAALDTIAEVAEDEEAKNKQAQPEPEPENGVGAKKKTVRFSELVSFNAGPKRLPSKFIRQESAYFRAFQDYIIRTQRQDAFVHQLSRFEALQAARVSLRNSHRNQLLGKYQLSVVPQSAKKRLSANVARGDDDLVDDPEKLRHEKELEAIKQMTMSTWHVAAMKMLNGGRLILAPVAKRLTRLSMSPSGNGTTRERARILDLGGQATCDWAWHCALQYPCAKIYTVTTKAIRQLSNSNIRGPPNHRQVAVERLTRLPFADNQFDLVSARELHSILKFVGENGEDEWESCLKECMRVLKPGGYLEFSLLDSDIINSGPIGLAKSVEFGFALKTLGYDPNPTKLWLGRLARAGFEDVRRMWMCLPMGPKRNIHRPPTPPLKDNPSGEEVRTCQMEAMVTGSSDSIAGVCSILGGWSWERWLLRCETEKVAGELRLADMVTAGAAMKEAGKCLDGVPAVFEEGRNKKSGFRMLNGYARKPRRSTDVIKIALAK